MIERFMPHGFCMRWDMHLVALHVISDALIALAYFSIPAALIVFIRKRRDMNFGFMFWLFSAFIFFCGITHVLGVYTLWHPAYYLEGWMKAATAVVSLATAAILWPIIPKALKIPNPRELQERNKELEMAGRLARIGWWAVEYPELKVYWSDEVKKTHGVAPDFQPSPQDAISYYTPESAERLRMVFNQCVKEGTPFDLELEITTAKGEERTIRLSGEAQRQGGNLQRIFGVLQDVTPQKQTERNLQEVNNRLTATLAKEQELSRKARAAEKAKGDFLASMSHEIRTPLNAILGMSSLLTSSDSLNSEQRDFLDTIRTSGEALTNLVTDILDYSKLDADAVTLQPSPGDLVVVAVAGLRQVAEIAEAKGLTLGLRVEENFPRSLNMDIGRIRQIILNLLSNAVKFTDVGAVSLSLGISRELGEEGMVLLSVTDSGAGITEAQIEKLFHPFSQADYSSTRKQGGTGLGLVIAGRIANAMGGDITVESTVGVGSTFRCSLRLNPLPAETENFEATLLLITRRPLVASTIRGLLAGTQAKVECAATIEEAHKVLLEKHVTVALVDHELAGTAAEVPRLLALSDIPHHLLTSLNRSTLRASTEGFTSALAYPPHPTALLDLVAGRKSTLLPSRELDFPEAQIEPLPLRILVAEDTYTNQKVIQLILSRLGYKADLAKNGLEAIAAWESRPYDLILMDIHMPEMDGIGATSSIRNKEMQIKRARCSIIALTADALSDTVKTCIEAGMDGYLTKPINIEALSRTLKMTRRLPI